MGGREGAEGRRDREMGPQPGGRVLASWGSPARGLFRLPLLGRGPPRGERYPASLQVSWLQPPRVSQKRLPRGSRLPLTSSWTHSTDLPGDMAAQNEHDFEEDNGLSSAMSALVTT